METPNLFITVTRAKWPPILYTTLLFVAVLPSLDAPFLFTGAVSVSIARTQIIS